MMYREPERVPTAVVGFVQSALFPESELSKKVGTFALIWSMNRHLKKLPERFDRAHPEPDQAADDGTVGEPADSAPDNEGTRHEPGG